MQMEHRAEAEAEAGVKDWTQKKHHGNCTIAKNSR
jgi:hypothetical protein